MYCWKLKLCYNISDIYFFRKDSKTFTSCTRNKRITRNKNVIHVIFIILSVEFHQIFKKMKTATKRKRNKCI